MAEYIERGALLKRLQENFDNRCKADSLCKYVIDKITTFPAAEVAPVRHGEWTKTEDDWNSLTTITCSECHEEWCFETEEDVSLLNYRYCPNCGARMDLGGAENA